MRKPLVLLVAIAACVGCSRTTPPHGNAHPPDSTLGTPQPPQSSSGTGAAPAHPQPTPPPPPPPNQVAHGPTGKTPYIYHLPHPTSAPAPAATEQSSLQQQIDNWYQHLGLGSIQYGVPSTMYWREAATVTVEIAGPKGPANDLQNSAGSAPLKVSDFMKVELTCPDDPDEFTIAATTKPVQFIAFNGSNRWTWTVTPRYTTSKPQNLVITAWVLYQPDDTVSRPILSYRTAVRIHVPTLGEALKKLIEGDPEYWLRYGLPGGSGFIFIAGCLAWLRQRSKKKKRAHHHRPVAHIR
jgi:hypothetical protein